MIVCSYQYLTSQGPHSPAGCIHSSRDVHVYKLPKTGENAIVLSKALGTDGVKIIEQYEDLLYFQKAKFINITEISTIFAGYMCSLCQEVRNNQCTYSKSNYLSFRHAFIETSHKQRCDGI